MARSASTKLLGQRQLSLIFEDMNRRSRLTNLGIRSLPLLVWAAAVLGAGSASFAQQPAEPPAESVSDQPSDDATESMFPHFKDTRFWLSGQANFILQAHPSFFAPYSGKNSLSAHYEKATSRVMTFYTGVRLNGSTEFLVDIEEAGGAALSTGLGLAGAPNLDIVRNPLLSKAPYLGRGMIHKVFALSKEKVENTRSFLSLFDELPRRRLEIRFGKFSMPDFFDINSGGSDTHFQFVNWSVDNNGAYDYAADTRGYTVGAVADYEDRNWGIRFAEVLMPKVANGIDLVWQPWKVHAENLEYELRRSPLPGKPGILRLLAYANSANMGVYREQTVKAAEEGVAPDIANHPWHVTRKYGFGVNVEQTLMPNITAFARWGWDNGRTESFAYTEIDSNLAAGIGAGGARWRRKQDRAGLAFVSNGIKEDHQKYLANGGYGFLIGDGRLNYGRENIVESYYTAHVWRGIYLAPGLQRVVDPGYNRDRGPVIVPSFRAHVEF
jgi:high affinity Mn2+ porin